MIIDNSELKDLSNADNDYSDSEKDESTNKDKTNEDTNEIKDGIQSSSVKENDESQDDDNSSNNNEKKEDEQEEIEKISVPNEAKGIKFSLFLIILIFFS